MHLLQKGAKAYEPVGVYPGRKWCIESEHPESIRCPLHQACVKGHLPVLRMLMKSSVLCFVTTDHLGRTPLQVCTSENFTELATFIVRKTFEILAVYIPLYIKAGTTS